MTKSKLFKAAHALARKSLRPGNRYAVTFAAALRIVYAEKDMCNPITREEAIKLVGLEAVEAVEAERCEPTNRVGYNGKCQGDAEIEWAASVDCTVDGYSTKLVAYYYTTEEDEEQAEERGDWEGVNWEIAGYEVR